MSILQVVRANNLGCTTITRYYKVAEAVSNNADVLRAVADGTLLANNTIKTVDDGSVGVLANVIAEIMPQAQVYAINLVKFPILELIAHQVPAIECCFDNETLLARAKELEATRKENEFLVVVVYVGGSDVRLVERKPLEKIQDDLATELNNLTMVDNVAMDEVD
jgi:hypothetical protein